MRRLALRFSETTGLKWLPELIGIRVHKEWPPKGDLSYADVKSKIQDLGSLGTKKIEFMEKIYAQQLDDTNERIGVLEKKALRLLGNTGIASALAVGLGGLLLNQFSSDHSGLRLLLGFLYGGAIFSFFFTAFLALIVVAVGNKRYQWMVPSPNGLDELQKKGIDSIRLEHVGAMLASYYNNDAVARRKASYLGGGQQWLRNSIVILLAISILISWNFVAGQGEISQNPGVYVEDAWVSITIINSREPCDFDIMTQQCEEFTTTAGAESPAEVFSSPTETPPVDQLAP